VVMFAVENSVKRIACTWTFLSHSRNWDQKDRNIECLLHAALPSPQGQCCPSLPNEEAVSTEAGVQVSLSCGQKGGSQA
jgi:hypothetical protein